MWESAAFVCKVLWANTIDGEPMEDHLARSDGVDKDRIVPGVFNEEWRQLYHMKSTQLESILKQEAAFKGKTSGNSTNTDHEADHRRERLAAAAERRFVPSTTSSQSNTDKHLCPQWRRFVEMLQRLEQDCASETTDEDHLPIDEAHSKATATEEAKRDGAIAPQEYSKATSPEEAKIDGIINDLQDDHLRFRTAFETGKFDYEPITEKPGHREPSHIFGGLPSQSSQVIHQRGLNSRGNELKKIQKETREQKINEKRMNGTAL